MTARRLIVAVGLAVVLVGAVAAPALGAAPDAGPVSFAVLGIDFPSVKSIVEDVVRFFFGAFLDALVPDWLKHASVHVLQRLVRLPNPTDARVWPTLARLSEAMKWIAIPLLSLAAVASWTQHWIYELTGRPASFEQPLRRTVLAAVLLVSYPFFIGQAVALVNTVTHAMLSVPVAGDGLERTVGLAFAGAVLSGGGLLLALLGIAAVLMGVGLFLLSVGLLVLFGILYVSAPLAIVCSVVDETHGIWTAWRFTLLTAVMIPLGWSVLFTTAGAFVLDMTTWSGGIGGQLGARLTGVFAALIILYLAVRWPLMLWGAIRTQIAGALMTVGARRVGYGSAGGASKTTGRAARAALQRVSMRAATAATAPLGTVRRYGATSARMMGRDGAAAIGRIPGIGGALRSAGGAIASAGPVVAAMTPVAAAKAAAGAVRGRAHAASAAAQRTLAAGGTTGAAMDAATRAATRPSQRQAGTPQSGRGAPGAGRRPSGAAEGRASRPTQKRASRAPTPRDPGSPGGVSAGRDAERSSKAAGPSRSGASASSSGRGSSGNRSVRKPSPGAAPTSPGFVSQQDGGAAGAATRRARLGPAGPGGGASPPRPTPPQPPASSHSARPPGPPSSTPRHSPPLPPRSAPPSAGRAPVDPTSPAPRRSSRKRRER